MVSLRGWRCCWSLVAATASFILSILLADLYFFSLLPPSVYYLSSGSHHTSHSTHYSVSYLGAPWKAEIGTWLAGCHSISTLVDVVENIGSKQCTDNCSSQGICNRDLGKCRCFHGFAGEACAEQLQLDCNLPHTPELPYGPRIESMCPGHCDTRRAMCFCGEGSAYPNRPLTEGCGFETILPSKPGDPKLTNWTKVDENIFTTNSSKPGWCNVDPKEAYASHVKFKEDCHCTFDGSSGRFCEIPTESSCINQCSEHGHCHGGFCRCDSGWYGIDCSIPSVVSPLQEWPKWLWPSKIDVMDKESVKATVKKKRPLIYVYDLPPEFDSHLLEGRHYKYECIYRLYDEWNRTLWTYQIYGAQMAIYESILASPYRTMNGEEADYFYVPALDSCIIERSFDAPHFYNPQLWGLRSYLTLDIYKEVYNHIVQEYPYWNRSSGRDHIWFFSWDEGACYAPKEIWNSIMLAHWGNTNTKHNHSTSAYWQDNWDRIPSKKRGNHTCFDPVKDIVLPAWRMPDQAAISIRLWTRARNERKRLLFYFNGNLGPAYENGRPETTYSMGIRQKVAEEFGSTPDKKGRLGKQHADDVIVTSIRSTNYLNELGSSKFCGVFPGDGWSARLEDSILQGCIPVIIQDGIFLPYENVLNFESFAIRISEDDIPNMVKILRKINETQIDFMLANVQSIWQRFLYRDAVMLEAARQEHLFGKLQEWAVEFSDLKGDDVFATLIQVLHYKLHNDPWRRNLHNRQKDFGLPKTCLNEAGHT